VTCSDEVTSCHAHMSNWWLRGYQARLLGEARTNGVIYQGQARLDWEAGHHQAKKDQYFEEIVVSLPRTIGPNNLEETKEEASNSNEPY